MWESNDQRSDPLLRLRGRARVGGENCVGGGFTFHFKYSRIFAISARGLNGFAT